MTRNSFEGCPDVGLSARKLSEACGLRDTGCVLIALDEEGEPSAILHQTAQLAHALKAPLHVLRVLRPRKLAGLFSRSHAGAGIAVARRALEATRATRSWCIRVLRDSLAVPVHIRIGTFRSEVPRFAGALSTKLIVLPPREGMSGTRVTGLVSACQKPVLVMRSRQLFRILVAATDLEDESYPVLRTAALLGKELDVSVLAIHNVNPLKAILPIEAGCCTTLLIGPETVKARRERLSRVASDLIPRVESVVSNHADTVHVILEQSRMRGPALVIVGTRVRPWLDWLRIKSVPAEVVRRDTSSVLVTPIGVLHSLEQLSSSPSA